MPKSEESTATLTPLFSIDITKVEKVSERAGFTTRQPKPMGNPSTRTLVSAPPSFSVPSQPHTPTVR